MPGMFIDVTVEAKAAQDPEVARKLEEVCPVDIFAREENGALKILEDNLDECVLCDLCLEAAPRGAVKIAKLYE